VGVPNMYAAELLCAGALGLLGGVAIYLSLRLPYWSHYGPGPGFLPLWLGVALAIIAAALVIEGWRVRESACAGRTVAQYPPADGARADGTERVSWFALVLGVLGMVLLVDRLGLLLAMSVFLLAGARWVAGLTWTNCVLVALLGPASFYLLFGVLLAVPFPRGPLGF